MEQEQPSQVEGSTSTEGEPSLQGQGDTPLGDCQQHPLRGNGSLPYPPQEAEVMSYSQW